MHKLENVREAKNTPVYVRCQLPEREDHVFKTPSMLVGMKLFQVLDQSSLMAFAASTSEARPETMFALMRRAGPEVIQGLGYLIGVSWFHPTLELDSKVSDHDGDILAYGEAVFEELHEEGYDLNQVVMMALAVIANWVQRNSVAKEAMEKFDFFKPTEGSSN